MTVKTTAYILTHAALCFTLACSSPNLSEEGTIAPPPELKLLKPWEDGPFREYLISKNLYLANGLSFGQWHLAQKAWEQTGWTDDFLGSRMNSILWDEAAGAFENLPSPIDGGHPEWNTLVNTQAGSSKPFDDFCKKIAEDGISLEVQSISPSKFEIEARVNPNWSTIIQQLFERSKIEISVHPGTVTWDSRPLVGFNQPISVILKRPASGATNITFQARIKGMICFSKVEITLKKEILVPKVAVEPPPSSPIRVELGKEYPLPVETSGEAIVHFEVKDSSQKKFRLKYGNFTPLWNPQEYPQKYSIHVKSNFLEIPKILSLEGYDPRLDKLIDTWKQMDAGMLLDLGTQVDPSMFRYFWQNHLKPTFVDQPDNDRLLEQWSKNNIHEVVELLKSSREYSEYLREMEDAQQIALDVLSEDLRESISFPDDADEAKVARLSKQLKLGNSLGFASVSRTAGFEIVKKHELLENLHNVVASGKTNWSLRLKKPGKDSLEVLVYANGDDLLFTLVNINASNAQDSSQYIMKAPLSWETIIALDLPGNPTTESGFVTSFSAEELAKYLSYFELASLPSEEFLDAVFSSGLISWPSGIDNWKELSAKKGSGFHSLEARKYSGKRKTRNQPIGSDSLGFRLYWSVLNQREKPK